MTGAGQIQFQVDFVDRRYTERCYLLLQRVPGSRNCLRLSCLPPPSVMGSALLFDLGDISSYLAGLTD